MTEIDRVTVFERMFSLSEVDLTCDTCIMSKICYVGDDRSERKRRNMRVKSLEVILCRLLRCDGIMDTVAVDTLPLPLILKYFLLSNN